ncbi:MAG TPA: lysylphosphatidylglycerol synthase transmembrane domain-containing protein [Ilumatobacteraceae bacterium]|nr:lysylphosphatidylglycerol synthase transmembrane domain-containing protein [Ilumatobacteraceae bacterium]
MTDTPSPTRSGEPIDDRGAEPSLTAPVERRWWHSRWVHGALSLGVVALIFGFLFPKVADYGEVWNTITAMTGLEAAVLVLIAGWNLVSYWPVLTATLPGLRLREAAVSNLASTAVSNTLPGGAAIGVGVTFTMQRSWGIAVSETALAAVIAGIWNNFVKLGLPIVALALLAVSGDVGAGLVAASLAGLAILIVAIVGFAALLRSPVMAARLGAAAGATANVVRRMFRREPVVGWNLRAQGFRAEVVGLLTQRWARITVTTLLSHFSLFLVLLVALRQVGVSEGQVGWTTVLAAFAFVRLLSAIPLTPGGLGVVELGLTAALGSGLPDSTKNQVAAAVLVYRGLTWFVPIPLGIGCWVFWRVNTSWRRTIPERRRWIADAAAPEPVAKAGS